MTQWEYCDVTWQPEQVVVTFCKLNAEPMVKSCDPQIWSQVLARLGSEGWEMTGCMASPMPVQEYFFYFKRPLGE